MERNYLHLTLTEFLDAITEKECHYELNIITDHMDPLKINGTVEELEEIAEKSTFSEIRRDIKRNLIGKSKYTFNNRLSEIDIQNYLEKVSGGFNPGKIKMILAAIEKYYVLDFKERIFRESLRIYKKNGWKIPKKKIQPSGKKFKGSEEFYEKVNERSIEDYEKMMRETHPLKDINLQFAISLLKEKLKSQERKAPDDLISKATFRTDVFKTFKFMSGPSPRNHRLMLNDHDVEKLVDWVTYYFENNFEVPKIDEPINELNATQQSVLYTFAQLFDQLVGGVRPDSLYELIKRCFSKYRDKNIESLRKSTKEPPGYKELIKN